MSSYHTPVLTTCDSDPTAYYSWQEKPECSVLIQDRAPPADPPQGAKQTKVEVVSGSAESISSPDAKVALEHIAKGRAKGDICALTFRQWLQSRLFNIGRVIDCHRWTVLIVGCIVLGLCCLGLKTVRLEADVEKLWVPDSGRIARELDFTQKMLGERSYASSIEVLLQTGRNLAHADALKDHLRLVTAAQRTRIRLGSREWNFQRLCQKINLDVFGGHEMSKLIEDMTPCLIISPLDCFWDGSKTLGPDKPVPLPSPVNLKLTWRNFDPEQLFTEIKLTTGRAFPQIEPVLRQFRQMGLSHGYQNRTCLDPEEAECPHKAPNFRQKGPVDVGRVLNGGCRGFASNVLRWPEALVVGGATRSPQGERLQGIRALQTLLVLRSPRDLYEEVRNRGSTHYDWSLAEAEHILKLWQEQLRKNVAKLDQEAAAAANAPGASQFATSHFFAFTDSSLRSLLQAVTASWAPTRLGGAALLVALFLTLCFARWKQPIRSHAWLALANLLLTALTIVAGLGIAAVFGLPFNVLTIKVLPLLMLGVAMDDSLRLTAQFDRLVRTKAPEESKKVLGEALMNSGPVLLLSSICNSTAIFSGALLPVPLMRTFCLQAGIVSCLQALSALLLQPALLSLDLQRRRAFRVDFLCCLSSRPENPLTLAGRPRPLNVTSAGHPPRPTACRRCLRFLSPRFAVRRLLVPCLRRIPAKALVVTVAAAAVGASGFGIAQLSYGLDFAAVVPRDSSEHDFVKAHHRFLGVYNFQVSTGEAFDYANNQELLRRFFDAIRRVPEVLGATPASFWLNALRDWLLELQTAFREDVRRGAINSTTGVWNRNATREGLTGMLMMIQTGRDDETVDLNRLKRGYLVDSSGIIFPAAFYNYLTAWRSLRSLQYEALPSLLRPQPRRSPLAIPDPKSFDWTFLHSMDRSAPLEFTQMNFYLRGVRDSGAMLRVVKAIRDVTDKFTAAGLTAYPSGLLFIFFEQYFHLGRALALCLGALGASFLLAQLLFCFNLRAALIALLCLAVPLLQLAGLAAALGMHVNGASVAVLLLCGGLTARQQGPILWSFLVSRGDHQVRIGKALSCHGPSGVRAALAMLLVLALLSGSQLDFIVTYFFQILSLAIGLGLFNGLFLLPSLLAFFGPPSQFRPSPGFSTELLRGVAPSHPEHNAGIEPAPLPFLRPRPASLSTISEEPSRLSSNSSLDAVPPPSVLVMEPEILLRTERTPRTGRPVPQACCHEAGKQVTTVKATAKFKVEVHSPMATVTHSFDNGSTSSSTSSSSSSSPVGRCSSNCSPCNSSNQNAHNPFKQVPTSPSACNPTNQSVHCSANQNASNNFRPQGQKPQKRHRLPPPYQPLPPQFARPLPPGYQTSRYLLPPPSLEPE